MKVKIINNNSPVLRAHRVLIGEIGEVMINDFTEKYDYKILIHRKIPLILYFYKEEVEVIKE